jgi:hypothetical protein
MAWCSVRKALGQLYVYLSHLETEPENRVEILRRLCMMKVGEEKSAFGLGIQAVCLLFERERY